MSGLAKEIRILLWFAIVMIVLSLVLGSVTRAFGASFRGVFGAVWVLLVPGYVLMHAFMDADSFDAVEKVAMSLALSVAFVPFIVLMLSRFAGVRFSALNVFLEVLGVVVVGFVVIALRSRGKSAQGVNKLKLDSQKGRSLPKSSRK